MIHGLSHHSAMKFRSGSGAVEKYPLHLSPPEPRLRKGDWVCGARVNTPVVGQQLKLFLRQVRLARAGEPLTLTWQYGHPQPSRERSFSSWQTAVFHCATKFKCSPIISFCLKIIADEVHLMSTAVFFFLTVLKLITSWRLTRTKTRRLKMNFLYVRYEKVAEWHDKFPF